MSRAIDLLATQANIKYTHVCLNAILYCSVGLVSVFVERPAGVEGGAFVFGADFSAQFLKWRGSCVVNQMLGFSGNWKMRRAQRSPANHAADCATHLYMQTHTNTQPMSGKAEEKSPESSDLSFLG